MEMTKCNCLYTFLTKNKNVFFSKMKDRKVKWVHWGWPQWEREDIREGCRGVNMVDILRTDV
jgi:hypothetical protein